MLTEDIQQKLDLITANGSEAERASLMELQVFKKETAALVASESIATADLQDLVAQLKTFHVPVSVSSFDQLEALTQKSDLKTGDLRILRHDLLEALHPEMKEEDLVKLLDKDIHVGTIPKDAKRLNAPEHANFLHAASVVGPGRVGSTTRLPLLESASLYSQSDADFANLRARRKMGHLDLATSNSYTPKPEFVRRLLEKTSSSSEAAKDLLSSAAVLNFSEIIKNAEATNNAAVKEAALKVLDTAVATPGAVQNALDHPKNSRFVSKLLEYRLAQRAQESVIGVSVGDTAARVVSKISNLFSAEKQPTFAETFRRPTSRT